MGYTEDEVREDLIAKQAALSLILGFSVTIFVGSLSTSKRFESISRAIGRIIIEQISGVGLKVGKLQARVITGVAKGAGGAVIQTRKAAAFSLDALVTDVGKGGTKTFRVLRFLNTATIGIDVALGARREQQEGGDTEQIIAGAAVGLATGVVTLGLLPKGKSRLVRDPATGTLVFQGETIKFFTAQNLTDLLGEAIRLVT